jgi:hypothetical protein
MIVAQGKRGTSATLGKRALKLISLSPRGTSGERDKGRGVSQFDRPPIAILNYSMPTSERGR